VNRKDTKEILEMVNQFRPEMEAFVAGKDIQVESLSDKGSWLYSNSPAWSGKFNYRIKPEPVRRPFNRAEAEPHVGSSVKRKSTGDVTLIDRVFSSRIETSFYIHITSGDSLTPERLMEEFTFLNGNPCSVSTEDEEDEEGDE